MERNPITLQDPKEWEKLLGNFRKVEAAGGIVTNPAGEVLLIFRRGCWDFPKGKVEEGENVPQAALREVREETGIHALTLTGALPSTFHTYRQNGEELLKETHWFAMENSPVEDPLPQEEEEITAARWVEWEEVLPLLENSFASLRNLWIKIKQDPAPKF